MSDTDERAHENRDDEGVDSESRRLCPDDNCIGVIGPDGKCKVCGNESPDGAPPAKGEASPPKPAAAVDSPAAAGADSPAAADAEPEAAADPEPQAEPLAAEPEPAGDGEASDFDPDERVLCPDDNCTGLIGADGKCKVCGAASPVGPPPAKGAPKATPRAPEKKPAPPVVVGKGEAKGFDPNDRVLCSDDCCTGLIGPDGKCKVCGKPYAG